MKYSLKQIEVFIATANFQNITLAAEALNMSQSAASESLKNLESQFDIKLFDRAGKRLQLNDFGRLIRKQAETLIDQAKSLELSLQQNQLSADLNIGATLSIGNYLAIHILSEFKGKFPTAKAALSVGNTTKITEQVANFELDVGLIEGEVSHPDLNIRPWMDDELVVFCDPKSELSTLSYVSDQQLSKAKWILREAGSGTRQAFDNAMQGVLHELNIELELQHTEAIKRAVESGMGIGCLSKVTLNDAFKRSSLIALKTPQRDFKRKFYIITHKDKYLSPG
ncbi:LysR family transcriptional regulator, partial [Oleiphilus sp. HI0081]